MHLASEKQGGCSEPRTVLLNQSRKVSVIPNLSDSVSPFRAESLALLGSVSTPILHPCPAVTSE